MNKKMNQVRFADPLFYSNPVYRPPSEGNSLLLTLTIGCSFKCTFCYPYKNKKFAIRSIEDVKRDIDNSRILYGNRITKIFLLDGNAFVVKPDKLIEISNYCYKIHKNLERISAYAHAKDIIRKSDESLKQIAEAGLTMVYLGIETGDDSLLKKINKQTTASELLEAAHKLHSAGIILSGTIILGLAGNDPELSKKHVLSTAKLINQMNPIKENQKWYISALTLMLPPGTIMEKQVRDGHITSCNKFEILTELKVFMENISNDLHGCIFRSNHASNYLSLKGILAEKKDELLQKINYGLDHPNILRSEDYRGL